MACPKATTPEDLEACIDTYVFTPDGECRRDRVWQVFRALYLAKRDELRVRDPKGPACARHLVPADKVRRVPIPGLAMEEAGFGDPFQFDDDPASLVARAIAAAEEAEARICPEEGCEAAGLSPGEVELDACGRPVPPASAPCPGCARVAAEADAHRRDLFGDSDPPSAARAGEEYERRRAAHLNGVFGFDLTRLEYDDFLRACDAAADGEPACGELTAEARDLERTLEQLAARRQLFSEPCLCREPYGDAWMPHLAPAMGGLVDAPLADSQVADASLSPGDAACDHTWRPELTDDGVLQVQVTSGCCERCELELAPVDPERSFDELVHFVAGSLRPAAGPDGGAGGRAFLIDAVMATGDELITVPLRGESCFPIATCTADPAELALCDDPGGDDAPDPATVAQGLCEEQLLHLAGVNAQRAYEEYLRGVKEAFRHRYTKQCLDGSRETFTMRYLDDEYHHTLYYYDQAGNLVRTIPPLGVELLTEGLGKTERDSLFEAVAEDRDTGERNVFTTHRMATTYQYNSLNQLVRQHMPDHDAMERWEYEAVEVDPALAAGEDLHAAGFADEEKGWVLADDPEVAGRGTIYVSADGGESWERLEGPGAVDFRVVAAPDDDTLYAAGGGGAVFAYRNGGASATLEATGASTDLVGLHFRDRNEGLAFAADGEIRRTTDGARSWSGFGDLAAEGLGTLDAVHFFTADRGIAAGRRAGSGGGGGLLLASADGARSWTSHDALRIPGVASFAGAGTDVVAVGADGRFLRRSASSARWTVDKAWGGRGGEIDEVRDLRAIAFFDAERGVVGGGAGLAGRALRFTTDGGETWAEAQAPVDPKAEVMEIEALPDGTVFAGLRDGTVLVSRVHGRSWASLGSSGLAELETIHAESESRLWAAGRDGSGRPSVYRWQGTWSSWATAALPGRTIVGLHVEADRGRVLLSDGALYDLVARSFVSAGGASSGPYVALRALPGGPAYAVTAGGTVARSEDGGPWATIGSSLPLPAGARVTAFWTGAGGRALAATDRGDIFHNEDLEGSGSWASEADRFALPPLRAVRSVTADVAYAVGSRGTLLATLDGGATWSTVATGHAEDLLALDTDAAGRGVVAGEDGLLQVASGLPGTPTWTRPALPSVASGATIRAVVLDGSRAYAVGDGGLRLRSGNAGADWQDLGRAAGDLHALAAARGAARTYAVGDDGWIGEVGSSPLRPAFRTERLAGTHGIGERAWVVGAGGMILASDDSGESWAPAASGTTADLHGVYFTDAARGVVVGEGGTILRSDDGGTSWRPVHAGGPDLADVDFGTGTSFGTANPEVGVAVGEDGTILRTSDGGVTWQRVDSTVSRSLSAVSFVNHVGFAVGEAGTILRSRNGGVTWEELLFDSGMDWVSFRTNPPATADLLDVYFRDYATGYALGRGGILLKTINGGLSWNLEDTGDHPEDLRSLAFFGDHGAFLAASDGAGFLLSDLKDRHSTRFYYDKLGRLVASQNSKQYAHRFDDPDGREHFSYTRYDALGRIEEVGQLTADEAPTPAILNSPYFPDTWSQDREQVTRTFYTSPMSAAIDRKFGQRGQENLRNRVASAAVYDVYDPSDPDFDPAVDYDHATHYSYDIHGNVKSLIQDNPRLGDHFPEHRFKRIDYEYDLVSGNVNEVLYQDGAPDSFYHRYEYDADNRLTTVHTSHDGVIWDRDAEYEYYRHGPLARMELGEHRVQGVDYAYTLQGWIKGVNSVSLVPERDIGKDGVPGTPYADVAPDVYGYSLGYYPGDYEPIDPDAAASENIFTGDLTGSSLQADTPPLFNSNISHMTTALTPFMESRESPQGMSYRYDQLNRLMGANPYLHLNIETNLWASGHPSKEFASTYEYDDSGNLLSLTRNGDPGLSPMRELRMDEIAFHFDSYDGTRIDNRLLRIRDSVPSTNYSNDLDDQSISTPASSWNYAYDELGNLVTDRQEAVKSIHWTVYGRVRTVQRDTLNAASRLDYQYDSAGWRIGSILKSEEANPLTWHHTYSVRDLTGNKFSTQVADHENERGLDLFMYGLRRIGVFHKKQSTKSHHGAKDEHTVGSKRYELTNHRLDVAATISDRSTVDPLNSTRIDRNGICKAQIRTARIYFPFGMQAVSQEFDDQSYGFGFNGKETENSWQGSGNTYDYGLRIYNPRLGRFISMDPLTKSYPWYSPYQFAGNKPIKFIDIDGQEEALPKTTPIRTELQVHNRDNTFTIAPLVVEAANGQGGAGSYDAFIQEKTGSFLGKFIDFLYEADRIVEAIRGKNDPDAVPKSIAVAVFGREKESGIIGPKVDPKLDIPEIDFNELLEVISLIGPRLSKDSRRFLTDLSSRKREMFKKVGNRYVIDIEKFIDGDPSSSAKEAEKIKNLAEEIVKIKKNLNDRSGGDSHVQDTGEQSSEGDAVLPSDSVMDIKYDESGEIQFFRTMPKEPAEGKKQGAGSQ